MERKKLIVVEVTGDEEMRHVTDVLMTYTNAKFKVVDDMEREGHFSEEKEEDIQLGFMESSSSQAPQPSRKRPTDNITDIPSKRSDIEPLTCELCLKTMSINASYKQRKNHALTHTTITFFDCPEIYCEYTTRVREAMAAHVLKMHGRHPDVGELNRKINLKDEQELDAIVQICFPSPQQRSKNMETLAILEEAFQDTEPTIECKLCHTKLKMKRCGNRRKEDHAIQHTDLMRYECPVDFCGFKTKYSITGVNHIKRSHNSDTNLVKCLPCLSIEEEEELRLKVLECFPMD